MNCAVHTDTPAVAYCRTCGKALCENCKRDVMGAIYCEPCIAARLQGAQPAVAAPPVPRAAPMPSTPSPGVAMLLGFIPGVGAMYNGQFMKAFVHVVLFALFIVGASTTHQTAFEIIFGLLIGFSPIYMAFDAYKTAEAKRMGLPLPDPLGLDRMFGLQETQSSAATTSASAPAAAAPVASQANAQTYVPPARAQDQAPVGAIVLIALGVIFLLGNFTSLDLGRFWPLILIALGVWIGYKRLTVTPRGQQ
jgi:TM2 domain-containing membrane protein YozV